MQIIRANASAVVVMDGMPVTVKDGQPFDTTDPIVRTYPWLFGDPIESATAAPGERRNTRKP